MNPTLRAIRDVLTAMHFYTLFVKVNAGRRHLASENKKNRAALEAANLSEGRNDEHRSYERRKSEAEAAYQDAMLRVAAMPILTEQKYAPGTFVWIAKDLGPSIRHFDSRRYARVQYTYAHAYGDDDVKNYSLLVRRDSGRWTSSSWYCEYQLTEVTEADMLDRLESDFGLLAIA